MIAKLIVYGDTREEAVDTMLRALSEFIIEPIKTTVDFHRRVLLDSDFRNGKISTHYVEKFFQTSES